MSRKCLKKRENMKSMPQRKGIFMIKSMTGYGRAEAELDGTRFLVEIKAVNHRYAEIVMRMPREFLPFEDAMKKAVLERVSRGRLDVFLTVEQTGESGRAFVVDEALAARLLAAADGLAERLGLSERLSLTDLLRQEGVLTVVDNVRDPADLQPILLDVVQVAAQRLVEMRAQEGARLDSDFRQRLAKLAQLVATIQSRSPQVVQDYEERLRKRLTEALAGTALADEQRLLTEVALLAERMSIDEELVRLDSHVAQFTHILDAPEPVGRKLDFLVQEMNREVNTIGSKANDLQIAAQVVEAKSVLEQIREQIQNVE